MKLKIKKLDVNAGARHIAVLHNEDARLWDVHNMERINLSYGKKTITAIVDTTTHLVNKGEVGLFNETFYDLCSEKVCKTGWIATIAPAAKPKSIEYIKKKLSGEKLSYKEFKEISDDIVASRLTDIEETYFVSACIAYELTKKEIVDFIKAMVKTGERFKINKKQVFDKHCVGGVAGNRTTMVVIPIIATYGLTIPKTSSRSITSPAGTADTVEVLCKVDLNVQQMKKVVQKTNGCMVWGGGLNLVPADDRIIRIEKPMSMDVLGIMLSSVLGKKYSVSATHVLIDIPWGPGSKIPQKARALKVKKWFEDVAKLLKMKIKVVLTDGTQPIGNGIGPVLEAQDVMAVLANEPGAPQDLKEKSIALAAELIALSGKETIVKAKKIARNIIESGSALTKFEEIIKAQGKVVTPSIGAYTYTLKAKRRGTIKKLGNHEVSKIARIAGAPEAQGAGVYLFKKVGEKVKKGEALMKIFSASQDRLKYAKKALEEHNPYKIR